jgi:large subunit ribosomal protein L3
MTRVFTEEGDSIPVTVIEVSPNRVTQLKNHETDGYRAVQVTMGVRRANLVNKPEAGHSTGLAPQQEKGWEFRADETAEIGLVPSLPLMFEAGQK